MEPMISFPGMTEVTEKQIERLLIWLDTLEEGFTYRGGAEEEEEEEFITHSILLERQTNLAVAWRGRKPTLDVERETLAARTAPL